MLGSNSQTSTVETFASISYVEGYLENADYLPTELQYYITHYRELACQIKEISADIMKYNEAVTKSLDASQKKQAILQIQRCLIKQNELGDQKLDILSLMADLIENKVRELETDEHFDIPTQPINMSSSKEEEVIATESQSRLSADIPSSLNTRSSNIHNNKVEDKQDSNKRKRHGRHRSSTQQEQVCIREDDKKEEEERPKKKKTRKDKANERLQGGVKIIGNIDPNEPVYCSCREVSYGEMIGCDNDNCHIEWFHFRCVDLTHKPKGKWFCPDCRGDRQNVMKTELVEQQRRAKKNAAVAIAGSCGD